jgi:hypothetical protein
VAQRRDFNAVDGLPKGALESTLSRFESEVDKALRKIATERSITDQIAWNAILNLGALFAVRNPGQRERVRQFFEDVAKMVMDVSLADEKRWSALALDRRSP